MVAAAFPEVLWPKPLGLEGVKSRKKAIFTVKQAYCKSHGNQSVNTFSGLELTLESRVAVIGEKLGRSVGALLLGTRKVVTGNVDRHDNLAVLHLGPELLGTSEQSVEQYLAAVCVALEQRPQVVFLDEAAGAGNEAWTQAFQYLLEHQETKAFKGALVIGAAKETPALKEMCRQRWTGTGEWGWQESIKEDDALEYLEDVLSMPEGVLEEDSMDDIIEGVRKLGWADPFNEDIIGISKEKGWNLTVLTTSSSSESEAKTENAQPGQAGSSRELAGFICYKKWPGTLSICRVAVNKSIRGSGHGRRLMQFVMQKAAQMPRSECGWISLCAVDTAVPFYERFGYMDMTADDVDDSEHFQTWMEMANESLVHEDDESLVPENDVSAAPSLAAQ